METKKIAVACFMGGILCVSLALLVSPHLWGIAILAGMAAGYLCYDLRDVLAAIPQACRKAYQEAPECWHTFLGVSGCVLAEMWAWFRKPHPFLCFGILLDLATFSPLLHLRILPDSWDAEQWFAAAVLCTFYGVMCCTIIYGLAALGAHFVETSFWRTRLMALSPYLLKAGGFKEKPVTYLNVLRWLLEGLFLVIPTVAIVLLAGICFFGILRPLWLTFKFVHCHERILCAIDGTLGGLLSLLLLHSYIGSFLDAGLVIIFGGLLGAAFGVINYEIVAKRLFHLQTA